MAKNNTGRTFGSVITERTPRAIDLHKTQGVYVIRLRTPSGKGWEFGNKFGHQAKAKAEYDAMIASGHYIPYHHEQHANPHSVQVSPADSQKTQGRPRTPPAGGNH